MECGIWAGIGKAMFLILSAGVLGFIASVIWDYIDFRREWRAFKKKYNLYVYTCIDEVTGELVSQKELQALDQRLSELKKEEIPKVNPQIEKKILELRKGLRNKKK